MKMRRVGLLIALMMTVSLSWGQSYRTAIVEYDPAIVALSDILKVVSDLGYIVTSRS